MARDSNRTSRAPMKERLLRKGFTLAGISTFNTCNNKKRPGLEPVR
jgi:hypothetical protein